MLTKASLSRSDQLVTRSNRCGILKSCVFHVNNALLEWPGELYCFWCIRDTKKIERKQKKKIASAACSILTKRERIKTDSHHFICLAPMALFIGLPFHSVTATHLGDAQPLSQDHRPNTAGGDGEGCSQRRKAPRRTLCSITNNSTFESRPPASPCCITLCNQS